ncbi:anti-sigma factor [Gordonia zhaorongruii]|uniref:anti-sigma factor n=1 Tax=Gordonia zhaorongruii TaxID=2597659 RepID=UPI00104B37D8|nr:anti-sigma factor [Gordonia zhaorongruii]
MTDREWLDDHVELYAIDSLPADENDEVQAQLNELPASRRVDYDDQIADVQELMAEYAQRYRQDTPATLRARVLADFDAGIGHVRTGTTGAAARSGSDTDFGSTGAGHAAAVTPIERARDRRRMAMLVGAAAAAIAVALGAGVIVGRSTAPETSKTTTAQNDAASVFTAPDAVVSKGTLDDARGVLTIVSSKTRNQAVATLRGAGRPLPDERTLQLWMVGKQAQPVSAGLFGDAAPPVVIDGLDGTAAFAVTLEPRGGSPAPTTPLLTQVKI